MATYTFVTEKGGSTIIEQFSGRTLREACRRWHRGSEAAPGNFPDDFDFLPPVPITDTKNVWCYDGHDPSNVFYLVHIIETQTNKRQVR